MKKTITLLIVTLIFGLILNACGLVNNQSGDLPEKQTARAEVVFQVTIPPPLDENPQYVVEIVDEVTGLPFNPTRYPLTAVDATHYFARVPFNLGSIIKYRYVRMSGIPMVEYNNKLKQVRYRLHQTTAPAILEDIVAGWEDQPYTGSTGNLEGILTNTENIPIPNAMIVAGGERIFTNSEGRFEINELPVGNQNVAVISLDGSNSYFEQGARIAENAVTPARIFVKSQGIVNITFIVTPPPGDYTGIPLRMIGELYQLGNTYADLEGGMSTIATRSPLFQYDPEKKGFQTVLSLPVGAYFQYKYSLGDGFWNSELNENNQFRIREITVPGQDATIEESIFSFNSMDTSPITFQITTPTDTPKNENVSIQFNPFSWMGSIPMWSQGNNQWKFILSSPLNMISQTGIRICRNDQCGITDADMTGLQSSFLPADTPQSIPLNITSWFWMNDQGGQLAVPNQVPFKGGEYLTGIEIQDAYDPRWQPIFPNSFSDMKDLNTNWVFLTPSWTVTGDDNLQVGPLPGKDPLWPDVSQQIQVARAFQFKSAVFPSLFFSDDSSSWNTHNPKNKTQWDDWFANYHSFLLFFADNASVNLADALIIGGPDVSGSIPAIIAITDINSASAENYSINQWQKVIDDLRAHFQGKIYWAVNYHSEFSSIPTFIDQLDGIYLLWEGGINYDSTSTVESMISSISENFPEPIIQSLVASGKPVFVGLSIPSASGPGVDCLATAPSCLPASSLIPPGTPPPGVSLDLQKQLNIYTAALTYFSNQPWVNGIVSRGYYPPAALMDLSPSIHGKPAAQTIGIWFGGLLGTSDP